MIVAANDYTYHFKEQQQTKVSAKLADHGSLDLSGMIRFIEGDRLTLELIGFEPVEKLILEPGTDLSITSWNGSSLCRCSGVLLQKIYSRRVFLRLTGEVIEKQAREYFRLDVSIPLSYTIPDKQLIPDLQEKWAATREGIQELAAPVLVECSDGFKLVMWNGQGEIEPLRVNLSGGGLRFKTTEFVNPESLIPVNLFLPLIPSRVIHVMAESLRCTEIMLGRGKMNNYITAMRFHSINEKDRETIIAYIFAEQRRIQSTRIA